MTSKLVTSNQVFVPQATTVPAGVPPWQSILAPYRTPHLGSSLWQLLNSLIPFAFTWYLMYLSLNRDAFWLTLLLAPLAAGFNLRLFIIFHDCCHLAFFKSSRANAILGSFLGILCFTPYYHWRHYHALHHSTTGNLTRRLSGRVVPLPISKYLQTNGDVLTLTVGEYLQLSVRHKLVYRLYRRLLLIIILMPLFIFVVMHRFANSKVDKRARHSVYWTNLALASIVIGLGLAIGIMPLLAVELPILALSTTAGVWLFYVQHQFEQTYWEPATKWNFIAAALQGSSYYKLPLVLQWFTGNIGFHHIHHLNPRIPNYNLQKSHQSSPFFKQAPAITLKSGLRSIFLRLWDEEQRKMVSFRQLKRNTRRS